MRTIAFAPPAAAAADALTPRTSRRQLRQQERALRQELRPDQAPPRVDPEPYVHELQNQVQRGELTISSFLDRLQQPELLALAGEGAQALRGIRQVITTQWQQARALPNPWSGGTAPALQPPVRLPDLSPWRELLNFELPPEAKAELKRRNKQSAFYFKGIPIVPSEFYEHTLEDAYGPVNLDYYPIKITKKPVRNGKEMSAEEFLEYFRLHINEMLDKEAAYFTPYEPSFQEPPTNAVSDKQRWNSTNPINSIVSISLGGRKIRTRDGIDYYFRPDYGAVITSASTPYYWRFTTINTPSDMEHAVSGHREFGVVPQANSYTLYIRGVDRTTGPFDSLFNQSVFKGGEKLWKSIQDRVIKEVERLGGEAEIPAGQTFSQRFSWPAVKAKYIRKP